MDIIFYLVLGLLVLTVFTVEQDALLGRAKKIITPMVAKHLGNGVEVESRASLRQGQAQRLTVTFNDLDGDRQQRDVIAIIDRNAPGGVRIFWDYSLEEDIPADEPKPKAFPAGRLTDVYDDMTKLKQELVLLRNRPPRPPS